MIRAKSEIIADSFVNVFLLFIALVTLYPILYILSLSFSSPEAVESRQVWLWPVGTNLEAYKLFTTHPYLLVSYANTILYTTVGTAYSLFLTILGGYGLSRPKLIGKNFFMLAITFTMLFSGGLIPTFLLVRDLGMYNTRWAIIIPMAVSPWYLIIMRTSMAHIPQSLEESAKIDGANDLVILFRIFLPMSVPVIATLGLFYGVAKWNDFFTALIYLNDKSLYPVQLVIRELLITNTDNLVSSSVSQSSKVSSFTPLAFKSAVVVVTMAPIMMVYPFLQRFFVKGVMIGAIKG